MVRYGVRGLACAPVMCGRAPGRALCLLLSGSASLEVRGSARCALAEWAGGRRRLIPRGRRRGPGGRPGRGGGRPERRDEIGRFTSPAARPRSRRRARRSGFRLASARSPRRAGQAPGGDRSPVLRTRSRGARTAAAAVPAGIGVRASRAMVAPPVGRRPSAAWGPADRVPPSLLGPGRAARTPRAVHPAPAADRALAPPARARVAVGRPLANGPAVAPRCPAPSARPHALQRLRFASVRSVGAYAA